MENQEFGDMDDYQEAKPVEAAKRRRYYFCWEFLVIFV
jgi:hypothetical protein